MVSDTYRQSATFRAEQIRQAEMNRLAKLVVRQPGFFSRLLGRAR